MLYKISGVTDVITKNSKHIYSKVINPFDMIAFLNLASAVFVFRSGNER